MDPDGDLDPDTDDLPLRANTGHILVRHYVLDLTVDFNRKVINGSEVLFLEPSPGAGDGLGTGDKEEAGEGEVNAKLRYTVEHVDTTHAEFEVGTDVAVRDKRNEDRAGDGAAAGTVEGENAAIRNREEVVIVTVGTKEILMAKEEHGSESQTLSGVKGQGAETVDMPWDRHSQIDSSLESTSDADFTLVLDCCDLAVSKVEELNITSVSAVCSLPEIVTGERSEVNPVSRSATLIQKLISIPSGQWRQQHQLFAECSRAPASEEGGTLWFHTDQWSLQVRKERVVTPQEFPRALRILYETRPEGGSVRWTTDQDKRVCVYTAGSPINNRALFPCQEPPVAMSTWQARVRAPRECVVLMSGENQAIPVEDEETGLSIWNYYVTMPMPASTFTLAVGYWHQAIAKFPSAMEAGLQGRMGCGVSAKPRAGPGAGPASGLGSSTSEVIKGSTLQTGSCYSGDMITLSDFTIDYPCLEDDGHSVNDNAGMADDSISCSHGDYPCRFTEQLAWSQQVVPHRVFAPVSLLQKAQVGIVSLLPCCLAAAHAVLGVHPFPRLDVLIVPAGFSSLGMASPHIVFLSQSVLSAGGPGGIEGGQSLLGSRLCHELAHSWFGLAIGARDWTEEWLSEGFATYLEDIIWAQAQKLSPQDAVEQYDLKALLRWRRLSDEAQNLEEELQVLRPNTDNTGRVSESGSSVVKHALNPGKTFMQIHYLKGYFLLRFLASKVGEPQFIAFFRLFVKKYHGQLILSQDFLRMLLTTFPDSAREGLTLTTVYTDWLDRPGIPKVRHRWCELVVKHGYSQAYRDVEHFLVNDQAMGVYLYGELMLQEDPEQQALAHRCLTLVREELDQSARKVVEEMIL
ncbi:aminopeptidase O [Lampris incognitus]|uniref:aminopeptidase O n=1 Tax=Lampris incognitus TaxID=2546036 RepID=UPI0024B484C4|nr:aminopeptidase O [Lampris incognitus]